LIAAQLTAKMRTIIVRNMTTKRATGSASAARSRTPSGGTPKQVSSDELLGPAGELVIVHGGRQYRLRVTQNGKLILTA